jgi:hypothetical protein
MSEIYISNRAWQVSGSSIFHLYRRCSVLFREKRFFKKNVLRKRVKDARSEIFICSRCRNRFENPPENKSKKGGQEKKEV